MSVQCKYCERMVPKGNCIEQEDAVAPAFRRRITYTCNDCRLLRVAGAAGIVLGELRGDLMRLSCASLMGLREETLERMLAGVRGAVAANVGADFRASGGNP